MASLQIVTLVASPGLHFDFRFDTQILISDKVLLLMRMVRHHDKMPEVIADCLGITRRAKDAILGLNGGSPLPSKVRLNAVEARMVMAAKVDRFLSIGLAKRALVVGHLTVSYKSC